MIQNDYIMKMIAQLSKVLEVILKLKEQRRPDDALREIDNAMQRIAGLNSQLVNSLSNESLSATLRAGSELDVGKALVIAELLKEEAGLYRSIGDDEKADARYFKSLHLYAESLTEEINLRLDEYVGKIGEIEAELEEYALPIELRERLIRVYERAGDFAAAEDVLFDLLEDEADGEAFEVGRQFYGRLLELTDEQLAKGNLPREEVLDGLARLGE